MTLHKQKIKHIFHRFCIVSVPQESKHHLTVNEVNGQKNLTAFFANNRIKLSDRRIRIFIHKVPETIVIPAYPAGAIHFKNRFSLSGLIADFPWKIQISGGDEA